MQVELIGYSTFVSKKSGNPCMQIAYAYQDPRWKGLKAEAKFVNPDVCEGVPKPGQKCNIDFNSAGFIVKVEFGG